MSKKVFIKDFSVKLLPEGEAKTPLMLGHLLPDQSQGFLMEEAFEKYCMPPKMT